MNSGKALKQIDLEMILASLSTPWKYRISLEQYSTPSYLAAALLYRAAQEGNVVGKRVADFGCGNGIFAIGAAILGASYVTGVDSDERMVALAEENRKKLGLNIKFLCADISEFSERVETVFMNPPFGTHNRGMDVPFIDKALELSKHFYIILDYNAGDFLRNHVGQRASVVWEERSFIDIPHTYGFHKRENVRVAVRVARVDVH